MAEWQCHLSECVQIRMTKLFDGIQKREKSCTKGMTFIHHHQQQNCPSAVLLLLAEPIHTHFQSVSVFSLLSLHKEVIHSRQVTVNDHQYSSSKCSSFWRIPKLRRKLILLQLSLLLLACSFLFLYVFFFFLLFSVSYLPIFLLSSSFL